MEECAVGGISDKTPRSTKNGYAFESLLCKNLPIVLVVFVICGIVNTR